MDDTGDPVRAGDGAPGPTEPRFYDADFFEWGKRRTRKQDEAPSIFLYELERITWRRADADPNNLTGLALSGGGIRSATFCLGVAQALHQRRVIDRLDYISTVSGGGYFGSSLVATMIEEKGNFAFGRRSEQWPEQPAETRQISSADRADTPAVGHLRNYSRYLIPRGLPDALTAIAVVVRGLAANAALVLWIPLIAAAGTVLFNPARSDLEKVDLFGLPIPWPPVQNFAITLALLLLLFVGFLGWGIFRSLVRPNTLADATGIAQRVGAGALVLLAATVFFEFQPYVIEQLFAAASPTDTADANGPAQPGAQPGATNVPSSEPGSDEDGSDRSSLLTWLGILLAPISALVTFFRDTIKSYLSDTAYADTYSALLGRVTAKVILWIGALALPLMIWIFYVHLSYWAIENDGPGSAGYAHSPAWAVGLKEVFWDQAWLPYAAVGIALICVSWLLAPNANSLHHLYRDRLARAFHFKPQHLDGKDPKQIMPWLSSLASVHAPYLLINTALNVQSSKEANRRGRNADFFLLSPLFVGSRATKYVPTHVYTAAGEPISLASAVAVSGAAASANMGALTIRPLSPTLAMLNIRLGYWLLNPKVALSEAEQRRPKETQSGKPGGAGNRRVPRRPRLHRSHFFMFTEMFGFMSEKDERVYLTDGGHIENLGVYELLRRRCKVIVAVDAEADPQMRFGSFITLQMYARIDMGIRIELPMQEIRGATLLAMGAGTAVTKPTSNAAVTLVADATAGPRPGLAGDPVQHSSPHVAVGLIDYGANEFGALVYIKASLTGDESDYVRDYGRRNPTFPHETTSDQFFSEEQFEVYRALGFHAAHRFITGKDPAIVWGPEACVLRKIGEDDELLEILRAALLPEHRSTPGAATADGRQTA